MPQANLTAQLLGLGGATADSYNRLSINAPAANSGVIRPVIPKVSGHPFRFYPATDSGASDHPAM
jgi:hypothetical protein